MFLTNMKSNKKKPIYLVQQLCFISTAQVAIAVTCIYKQFGSNVMH